MMLPTYTTNITGLRSCTLGESLRNESAMAAPMSVESNNASDLRTMPRSLSEYSMNGVQL